MKKKHTAKRSGEFYIYRGWLIKKYNNNLLNDPEIRGNQWNTYENQNAYVQSNMTDIARSLRDAKMYIDICEDREKAK
jgi:hypothetical protein